MFRLSRSKAPMGLLKEYWGKIFCWYYYPRENRVHVVCCSIETDGYEDEEWDRVDGEDYYEAYELNMSLDWDDYTWYTSFDLDQVVVKKVLDLFPREWHWYKAKTSIEGWDWTTRYDESTYKFVSRNFNY